MINSWWWALLLATPIVLYGVHRLGLWLESKGHLYYWHRKPEGSSIGSLVELQKALDPTTRHVMQIKEQKRRHSDEEASGQDSDRPG